MTTEGNTQCNVSQHKEGIKTPAAWPSTLDVAVSTRLKGKEEGKKKKQMVLLLAADSKSVVSTAHL